MTTYTIGIDVGGTKIEAILHDGKKTVASHRVSTQPEKGYKHLLGNIVTAVSAVRTSAVTAVGIGVPGSVHRNTVAGGGTLRNALNGKRVAHDLSKLLGLPVVMENDAKLFAYAEAKLGAGKNKQHVVGLIIGTGVGAGIINNGVLLRGATGGAGEIGEGPFGASTFEYAVGGPAYVRVYRELGGRDQSITTARILTARTKDKAILQAREQTMDATARLVATVINAYNPEIVVLGGGVSLSLDISELKKRTKQYTFRPLFDACTIARHKLSDSAGAIGAAMLARESLK